MFYADDWNYNVLGKFSKIVHTPNIDQMADNGIIFTENSVTTGTCWISRASMLSGTYASRHQFLFHSESTLFTSHPWNETLFPLLKSNGYYTGLVGKWHAPQPTREMEMAFNYSNTYYGRHWEERDGQLRHVTDLNLEDALDFLQTKPNDQKFALAGSFFATHAWDNHEPPYNAKNETHAQYYNNITVPS